MKMKPTPINELRTHRRVSKLSQRDLARAVGYRHAGPVVRHESLRGTPSLTVAIGYEIVFHVPVARIFIGLRNAVEKDVEARLSELEASLGARSARERDAKTVAQKLMWLAERKNAESNSKRTLE